jgi:hypothetical protein
MATRLDGAGVSPVVPAQAPAPLAGTGDPRQQALGRALQGLVGESLQGQLVARLADGSFVVRVAGTAARMQLPAGAQVGTEIPMTVVAASPRPTFQIGSGNLAAASLVYAQALPEPGNPVSARALQYAQGAALAGKGLSFGADGAAQVADSVPATLSDTARVLTSVLATAMKTPNPPTSVVSATPLLPGAELAPEQLARALGQAIADSGLFYESHVADWADGKRALADLAREPQMQRAQAGAGETAAADDPATAQFINLQLSSHEQGRVSWQGQLFPGQPLQWELSKDAPQRGHDRDAEAQHPWRSGMRLRFPLLGEISATITLSGEQLHIQLDTGSGDAKTLLQANADRLATALDAAGTPLSSLHIGSGSGRAKP